MLGRALQLLIRSCLLCFSVAFAAYRLQVIVWLLLLADCKQAVEMRVVDGLGASLSVCVRLSFQRAFVTY